MTIEQLAHMNAQAGGNWFDRTTSRFFGTRYHSKVYAAHAPGVYYFVTSDKDHRGERRYNVRRFDQLAGCTVHTVGAFGIYTTRAQAHAIARSFANEK